MDIINQTNQDLVVVTGDYVDDSTTKEDMIRSCQALGALRTTYGVCFVFGNHDEGYYRYRAFYGNGLREELRKNGVIILEDECADITDRICLIGRKETERHRPVRYGNSDEGRGSEQIHHRAGSSAA